MNDNQLPEHLKTLAFAAARVLTTAAAGGDLGATLEEVATWSKDLNDLAITAATAGALEQAEQASIEYAALAFAAAVTNTLADYFRDPDMSEGLLEA